MSACIPYACPMKSTCIPHACHDGIRLCCMVDAWNDDLYDERETCIGCACRVHDDVDDNHNEDVGVDGGCACQDRLLW